MTYSTACHTKTPFPATRPGAFVATAFAFALALAATLLCLGLAPSPAIAAEADGISLSVATDKASYQAGDKATVKVTVANGTRWALGSAGIAVSLPAGMSLSGGSLALDAAGLAAGESRTFTLTADVAAAAKAGGMAKASDGTGWTAAVAASATIGAAIALVLLVRRGRAAGMLAVVAVALCASAAVPTAALGATVAGTLSDSAAVSINGQSVSVGAELRYSYDDRSVTGIALNEGSITLGEGGTLQLEATVSPEDAADKRVAWESGDPSIASVDGNGLVTGVSLGQTTVTATTLDGGHKATCTVLVAGYTLTASVVSTGEGTGTASVVDPRPSYLSGTEVTVKAVPDTSTYPYTFLRWVATDDPADTDAVSTEAEYTFEISDDTELFAVFSVASKDLPEGLIIEEGVVLESPEVKGDVVIPNIVDGYPVTSIAEEAFVKCEALTSIVIPDTVTTIGKNAFYRCIALRSVTLSDSIEDLPDGVFYACSKLESVDFGDNPKVKSIGTSTFCDCVALSSIAIPDSVEAIGGSAFGGCSALASVTFGPDSALTSFGGSSFNACKSLESIAIPDSVEVIGTGAFGVCTSLNSVTVGKSVTTIGNSAFLGCSALRSITLSVSVKTINDMAFRGCTTLETIIFEGKVPDTIALSNVLEETNVEKVFYTAGAVALDPDWEKPELLVFGKKAEELA